MPYYPLGDPADGTALRNARLDEREQLLMQREQLLMQREQELQARLAEPLLNQFAQRTTDELTNRGFAEAAQKLREAPSRLSAADYKYCVIECSQCLEALLRTMIKRRGKLRLMARCPNSNTSLI